MNKFLFNSFFALLLVGCATTANYEKMLQTTLGMSENNLVARFGIPQGSYENDGIRYLTYSRSESGVIPGQPARANTVVIGGVPYTNMVGGTSSIGYTNSCSVTFTIVNKLVTAYRYKGNDCRAY